MGKRGKLAVLLGALLCYSALPGSAAGAVIAPSTTSDQYATGPGQCSLREAVESINLGVNFGGCIGVGPYGSDGTIRLAPGSYVLTIPPEEPGSDNSTGDLNTFASPMTIEALPGGPAVIDGNGTDRILVGGDLQIQGVSLTGGFVNNPEIGSAVIGGAIFTSAGSSLEITDAALYGNTADGFGGAIAANGPTTLTNVTVSQNTTTELAGGGISFSGASLLLDHVTVTGNASTHDEAAQQLVAGGLYTNVGDVTVHNSIIAGNSDANETWDAPDCQGAEIESAGGNLIGDTTGCDFDSIAGDLLDADPGLGPFADNGGAGPTHALFEGSEAIRRGVGPCPPADQRGYPRPLAPDGPCDAGAYERFLCDGVLLDGPGPFPGCGGPPSPPISNNFTFAGKPKHNRRRGTAILRVRVPLAGRLVLAGRRVRRAVKNPPAAATVRLLIRAKARALRRLNRTGRVRVNARVTYTPAGGTPRTKSRRVKLIKRQR